MTKILRELEEKLGPAGALEVARRWGNLSLYVPVQVREHDPLALALGLETARALSAAFGGQTIEVQGERQALRRARNDAIVARVQAGESHTSVANRFGVTRQYVSYLVKQAQEAPQIFAGANACAES